MLTAKIAQLGHNYTIDLVLAWLWTHRSHHFSLLPFQMHYNFTIMIMFKHSQAQLFMPCVNPGPNTASCEEMHSQSQESSPGCLPQEKLQYASIGSPQMKVGKKLSKRKKNGFSVSLWRLSENIAYMDFLKANEALFTSSRLERKQKKINILMSQYIKSRSPAQCRSHHQKMGKHHGDIKGIIRHIERLMVLEPKRQQESMASPSQETSLQQSKDIPLANLQQMEDKTRPIFDWCSWMHENELLWEQKMNEEWMGVICDSFGSL